MNFIEHVKAHYEVTNFKDPGKTVVCKNKKSKDS